MDVMGREDDNMF